MFIYGFTCKDLNVKSLASLFQPHCILMNKKCVTLTTTPFVSHSLHLTQAKKLMMLVACYGIILLYICTLLQSVPCEVAMLEEETNK